MTNARSLMTYAASLSLAAGALAACGGDATPQADLPPAAQEGLTLMRSKGCGACHGSDGGGLVGPALVGLFGSEVQTQTGAPVIADRDYVRESIVDPNAVLVEGYSLQMPEVDLTDDEVDSLIAYVEAVGLDATGPTAEEAQP